MPEQYSTNNRSSSPSRNMNWWKIAFFGLLVLFEIAREWAVIGSYEPAEPAVLASVYGDENYATATGRWTRIDGGEKLAPALVQISCNADEGQCIQADVTINSRQVFAPNIAIHSAVFSPEAVSFVDNDSICVVYSVRLDLKLKKAFAVRERKAEAKDALCKPLENRIEMQLADGFDASESALDGHFVPLFRIVAALLS